VPQTIIPVKIRFQPKQMELWRLWDAAKFTRIGYGGARGGGKSGAGRRCMLLRRLQYPNTTGLVLRRTYPELYKSHIIKLFEEFPIMRPWWRQESKELIVPNGSRLFFGSAEHDSDMAGYYSIEFADIMVDEAQEFSQNEMERLSGSCRCTSNKDLTPTMLFTFMPGLSESGIPPKGLQYLKRVFVDGQRRGEEARQQWSFVQAFAWDNIEWARKELEKDQVSEKEFYRWTPEERRDYFINRTEFGAVLAAITDANLRKAWLDGRWDIFQGQYFSNFDYEQDTVAEFKIQPWYRLWISGDWGYDHPAVFYWHAEDENGIVTTYREYWSKGAGELALGQTIGAMTGNEKVTAFQLSWDAFGKLNPTTRKSIVDMLGAALPKSVPRPQPADASPGSRISGWRLMHQLIDKRMWKIHRSCTRLIECLPQLVRDMERNSEDVLKVDYSDTFIGDDPADAARYGLQGMVQAPMLPYDIVRARALASVPTMSDGRPNIQAIHMKRIHLDSQHTKGNAPILLRRKVADLRRRYAS
jgi:phage terminase large subunit